MKYQALLSSKDKIKYNKIVVCSISIISGRWKVDDERLCATRLRLRFERISLRAGIRLVTSCCGTMEKLRATEGTLNTLNFEKKSLSTNVIVSCKQPGSDEFAW